MRHLTTWLAGLVWGALLVPSFGAAQVGHTLPHAMGLGGNYTALARGFSAVLWNPAGLGLADNPGASLTLLPVSVTAGLGPVTPSDLAAYDGQLVPHGARVQWLDRIRSDGGERGNADTDLTYLAFSVGRLAFSASSSVRGRVNLGPDVAELLLFGNAGLTGDPRDFTLERSNMDVAGTSTLAASLGLPLRVTLGPLPDQQLAVGATVKYTIGHFLLMGQERGSILSADPVEVNVRFPVIHTEMDEDNLAGSLNRGAGLGLDMGAAWQGGRYSAGVAIRNIVNTFEWNRDALRYREGTALWSADSSHTAFEEQPLHAAPADLVARIDEFYTFSPVLAAGAAARVLPYLTVSGELRHALEENLDVGARTHVGVGGQLTIVPFLPLRAGVALVSGGYQLSGGVGLRLGGMQLGAAGAVRESELGRDAVATLGLTFGIR
jgi:hypothetical protein